jgi:integrase
MKRPSCEWKGQADADEESTRSAGSPISRMPQRTKGGLRPTRQPNLKPAISETLTQYIMHLQKQAYAEQTIRTKYKILRVMLNDNVNLDDPETVKLYISRKQTWSNGHKILAVYTYNEYAKMKNIHWTIPQYQREETLPFVPTEKEIDALINGTAKKLSTALQALKETGFRIGELWQCKWTDIDEEKSTLKCKAEKHGKPRETKITAKLISRLNALPKINDYIFGKTPLNGIRTSFDKQKIALANKLQNPRLKQIHFHTLRHYYATRLYNETKSILEVQAKLGHRRIDSTMVYTHIVEFDEESQNYHHAIAKDEKEAGELLDNGWTYILTTPQNVMMFRKRK